MKLNLAAAWVGSEGSWNQYTDILKLTLDRGVVRCDSVYSCRWVPTFTGVWEHHPTTNFRVGMNRAGK
jgi:hypothetical protein